MTIYRIFLLGLLSVCSGFFSVNVDAVERHGRLHATKNSTTSITKSRQRHTKTAVNKAVAISKPASENEESDLAKKDGLEKPLDLSIPFADIDKSDRSTELNTDSSFQKTNIFANDNKKTNRPLQLNGRFIMSPEPESEKLKSADGAGIVINLKP
jgi:hypothetical protein